VNLWVDTNVSEERTVSIFIAEENIWILDKGNNRRLKKIIQRVALPDIISVIK
jgi:hypothetical protein